MSVLPEPHLKGERIALRFPKATRSQPICRITVSRHCLGVSPWLGIDFSSGGCFLLRRSTSF